MIEYIESNDIYKYDVECKAIVVPVNCVGVAGAGAALAFKQNFPDVERQYHRYCKEGLLRPGKIFYVPSQGKRPAIICLATKDHWRDASKLEWIESGLLELRNFVQQYHKIDLIRVPQIGCGLGGLEWRDVRNLIENIFAEVDVKIQIYLYAPKLKRK